MPMKSEKPRWKRLLKVRWMMLLIAAIAVLLGTGVAYKRRADLLVMMTEHENKEIGSNRLSDVSSDYFNSCKIEIERLKDDSRQATHESIRETTERAVVRSEKLAADFQRRAEAWSANAAFHSAMKEKYKYYANHPWLVAPPDGPEPPRPFIPEPRGPFELTPPSKGAIELTR